MSVCVCMYIVFFMPTLHCQSGLKTDYMTYALLDILKSNRMKVFFSFLFFFFFFFCLKNFVQKRFKDWIESTLLLYLFLFFYFFFLRSNMHRHICGWRVFFFDNFRFKMAKKKISTHSIFNMCLFLCTCGYTWNVGGFSLFFFFLSTVEYKPDSLIWIYLLGNEEGETEKRGKKMYSKIYLDYYLHKEVWYL